MPECGEPLLVSDGRSNHGVFTMCAVATSPRITPEEYLALPDRERFELVDGHLIEVNVNPLSSWVGGRLHRFLDTYVDAHQLGWAWPADNLYRCFPKNPGKVRKPDVSFIRRERMTAEQMIAGIIAIAPDLAAEVVSPNDLALEVDEKVADYLEAGVLLVWVVNPLLRTIRIHRADGSIAGLTEREPLSGEDVVPGFSCPVASLFPAEAALPSNGAAAQAAP